MTPLQAAVLAYDNERCRLNTGWHGSKCLPMSEANRETIAPMIEAAINAYLQAKGASQ